MISIGNKCCGCNACCAICPQKCITMQEDEEGFRYPIVNKDKCIDCGLCEKACPILNKKEGFRPIHSYVLRDKREEVVLNSASGGFITPISEYFISQGGSAVGAAFGPDFAIKHYIVETDEDIKVIRGSKYVQSDMDAVFGKVKNRLIEGKLVLFSGTPCQIAGLYGFLMKDYDNLYTVSVVCKGVASPKLWREYLKFQEKKERKRILSVDFRKKTLGYHSSNMELTFSDGNKRRYSKTDYFLKAYVGSVCMRPSCYECHFKGINRLTDFTIFDAWNVTKVSILDKDDDKGYTNLFIHTKKGIDLFEKIKMSYSCYESLTEEAVDCDGIMISEPTKFVEKRKKFYTILTESGISKAVDYAVPVTAKDKIIEATKPILHRMGLLKLFKNLYKVRRKNNV